MKCGLARPSFFLWPNDTRAHLFVFAKRKRCWLVGITHQPPNSQPSIFFVSLLSREGVLCPSAIRASVGTHLCTHILGAYLRPKALRVAFIFVAVNLSSLQAVIRDRVERRRYCGETGSTRPHSPTFFVTYIGGSTPSCLLVPLICINTQRYLHPSAAFCFILALDK